MDALQEQNKLLRDIKSMLEIECNASKEMFLREYDTLGEKYIQQSNELGELLKEKLDIQNRISEIWKGMKTTMASHYETIQKQMQACNERFASLIGHIESLNARRAKEKEINQTFARQEVFLEHIQLLKQENKDLHFDKAKLRRKLNQERAKSEIITQKYLQLTGLFNSFRFTI
jgi:chromosome segregation ATPase